LNHGDWNGGEPVTSRNPCDEIALPVQPEVVLIADDSILMVVAKCINEVPSTKNRWSTLIVDLIYQDKVLYNVGFQNLDFFALFERVGS